jgi:hypothetical protein
LDIGDSEEESPLAPFASAAAEKGARPSSRVTVYQQRFCHEGTKTQRKGVPFRPSQQDGISRYTSLPTIESCALRAVPNGE